MGSNVTAGDGVLGVGGEENVGTQCHFPFQTTDLETHSVKTHHSCVSVGNDYGTCWSVVVC